MLAQMNDRHTPPLLAALAVVLVWGLNFPLQKALFGQIGPVGFLGVRYLLMPFCAVALLCWRFGTRWPRLDRGEVWPLVRLTLVGQGLHLSLSALGMQDSTAFSASVLLLNWTGDTLTASVMSSGQLAASAQAVFNTNSPSSLMRPVSSAIGMNSAGEMTPRSG